MTLLRSVLFCFASLSLTVAHSASETVQIDIRALCNARIVTTFAAGRLVPWRDSLDGSTSGEATLAAAKKIGEPFTQALPDDGVFPANDRHPRAELHFSNADGTGNQVKRSLAADDYVIAVPSQAYRELWLFVMSGFGESTLKVHLAYADGGEDLRDLVVPDWYFPVKDGDPHRVDLAEDLGKWNAQNHQMEKDHHFLHGFDLSPDPKRVLVTLKISKTAKAVLTLWGVTGVTP